MQIEMSAKAAKLLEELLSSLDAAYREHRGTDNNKYDAMFYDDENTIGSDPIEYNTINMYTLRKASELKELLRM